MDEFNNLFVASEAFIYLAFALFVANVALQGYRAYQKRQRHIKHMMGVDGYTEGSVQSDDTDEDEKAINWDTAFAHTCNTFALLAVAAIWSSIPNAVMSEAVVVAFNIINIAVATCVILVEMRVRKREVSRGFSNIGNVEDISKTIRTHLSSFQY